MVNHKRLIEERVLRLAERFPAVAVFGARQVGKSTLLNRLFGKRAKTFVFSPFEDEWGAKSEPELFLEQFPPPLILDEVQHAPELLSALKRKVDKEGGEKGMYFMTGSQNLPVMRGAAESLAGRVGIAELFPMTPQEWSGDTPKESWLSKWLRWDGRGSPGFNGRVRGKETLAEALWRGFMPGLTGAELSDTPDFHRSYTASYLERDARVAGDIRELDDFRRFLSLAAELTACEINFSQIGRDIGVARPTAQKWLSVLKATYQWETVPPWHGNSIKRLSGHNKGYFIDSGLCCFLRRISSPDTLYSSPGFGKIFESAAVSNIMKLASAMSMPPAAFHWRRHSGAEVDLALEIDGGLFPFEVKASSRITKADAAGINAFNSSVPKHSVRPGAVIAPVEEPFRIEKDIWVLPWDLL
jgi:predicted AAA+ superfamily ATPase